MIAYTLVLFFFFLIQKEKNSVFSKLLIKHIAGFNFLFIKNISVLIHIFFMAYMFKVIPESHEILICFILAIEQLLF